MSEPQPTGDKPIWLGLPHRAGLCRSGRSLLSSRVVGAVEIRGTSEPGMGCYLHRVRRNCPPLVGLNPSRATLWSSNQSAISQRDWVFHTVRAGVDPIELGFLPRFVEVLEMWNDLWTGDGTLSSQVELAQCASLN